MMRHNAVVLWRLNETWVKNERKVNAVKITINSFYNKFGVNSADRFVMKRPNGRYSSENVTVTVRTSLGFEAWNEYKEF